MGKTRIIAETGAGQHGVATATACALFGLPCEIYMGAVDVERQALNVFRMKLLGAKVHPVKDGTATLKDAMNEALRDWVTNVRDHALRDRLGGRPAPVSDARARAAGGDRPRGARADPGGGGAPARRVRRLRGRRLERDGPLPRVRSRRRREAVRRRGGGRRGRDPAPRRHAGEGRVGVLHGARSYVLCDDDGQISEAHSISAGLDYPGVGPEHSFLKDTGRADVPVGDRRRGAGGLQRLARTEGILRALESAHAIAALPAVAATLPEGRGGDRQRLGARRQGHGDDRRSASG